MAEGTGFMASGMRVVGRSARDAFVADNRRAHGVQWDAVHEWVERVDYRPMVLFQLPHAR